MVQCAHRLAGCLLGLLAIAQPYYALASESEAATLRMMDPSPKSAPTDSLGSRATVTSTATVFGSFAISSATVVYILIRGNSLGTLGVTQGYLDAPRARFYNAQGQDIVTDLSGRPGFNLCSSTNTLAAPVVSYYQNTRGAPTHERDACVAVSLQAGVYTFSVTPSITGVTSSIASAPSSGEVLFEVTLGASAPVETNQQKTTRLIGGTWTYTYTLGIVFNDHFTYTSLLAPNANGDYFAQGTDAFGTVIVGGYQHAINLWTALNRHSTFDEFYTFTFGDNNHVSGCYYFIQPSGSSNLGNCYPLVGVRAPFLLKSFEAASDLERKVREAQGASSTGYVEAGALEAYLELRKQPY
jgi:hypothetical protein